MIRRTRPNEIKLLPQIETDADRRFARAGLLHMLNRPPATIASLDQGRGRGLLWVAVSPFGQPLGFALMKLRGGTAWLDQLSVLDRCQRLGHGAALIDPSAETARTLGLDGRYVSPYPEFLW